MSAAAAGCRAAANAITATPASFFIRQSPNSRRQDTFAPGKPLKNAFAESFIGRLRDELLNETLFPPARARHPRSVARRLQPPSAYTRGSAAWQCACADSVPAASATGGSLYVTFNAAMARLLQDRCPRNQPPITFNAVTAAAQRDRLVWILPRLTSP